MVYVIVVIVLVIFAVFLQVLASFDKVESFQGKEYDVLVINLDRRPDRMQNFDKSYQLSAPYKRIPAIDSSIMGKDVMDSYMSPAAIKRLEEFRKTLKRNSHEELTTGAVGCYLSHVKAWYHCLETNRPCYIFEDDASVPKDFEKTVAKLGEFVGKTDKPTMLLFHVICNNLVWEKLKCHPVAEHENLYQVFTFWSLAAYYITPDVARVLVEYAFPIEYQVDYMISMLANQGFVDIYAYPCVYTVDHTSDIQVGDI